MPFSISARLWRRISPKLDEFGANLAELRRLFGRMWAKLGQNSTQTLSAQPKPFQSVQSPVFRGPVMAGKKRATLMARKAMRQRRAEV